MKATPRSMVSAFLLGGALAVACGGVESEDDHRQGDAGAESDGAAGASSGGAAGGSGSAGQAGQAGAGATAGAGGSVDASSCQSSYDLGLCILLVSPAETSTFVVPPFLGKVNSDCRVKKLITKPPFEHANELAKFTRALWGCEGQSASTFGPALGATKLSAADAAILIDYYTELNVDALTLGPKAEQEMRDALACLAQKAITNPSTTEYEHSACVPDSGVEAGSDGSPDDASNDDAQPGDAGADADSADAFATDAESDVLEGGTD